MNDNAITPEGLQALREEVKQLGVLRAPAVQPDGAALATHPFQKPLKHPHTDGVERLDARAVDDELRLSGNGQRIELPVEGADAQRGPATRQREFATLRLRDRGGGYRRVRRRRADVVRR